MVMMFSNEDTISLVPCWFLISLIYLDHFPVDPTIAPIEATGYQLVTLCRSFCVEEGTQGLDPLTGSKYFAMYFIASVSFLSSL